MSIRFGTAGTSESFKAMGYKDSLDVPEYTAKFGLNAFEYQCGRGVRLGEAICRMRMERAQALLRGTDLRLEEIARSVGFENARYFVTVYQKQTGEHPLDFRKREQR